jgi:hypothetical protein
MTDKKTSLQVPNREAGSNDPSTIGCYRAARNAPRLTTLPAK